MAKTIWKYPFEIKDDLTIEMPAGAEILSVQVQHGEPCIWVLVDPSNKWDVRHFMVRGTGHSVDFDGRFIGTIQIMGGSLVFHLFELA